MSEEERGTRSNDVLKQWMDAALLHPMDSFHVHSFQNDLIDAMVNGAIPIKRVINHALTISTRSQFRATEQHLRGLIVVALDRIPGFSEAFASVLAANVKTYVQSFASARLIVLRVSLVVLAHAATHSPATASVASIATSQSLLLESMQHDPRRLQKIARTAVLRVLQAHKDALLPIYVSTITESSTVDQPQYLLWLVLCESQLLTIEVHTQLWTCYLYWAFEAKNRTRVPLTTKDLRFQSITPDLWDSLVAPLLTKVLRRSPDSALEAMIELIRAVPIDIGSSTMMEILMQVMVNKLKSTNEDVRRWTVLLARALLATFQSIEPFNQLIGVVISLLDGKHGLLAQFYMREAAFAVLCNGSDAIVRMSRADQETVASTALLSLVKAVEKEAHDATRDLGMLALGKWMAMAPSTTNDVVWKTIESGLGHKQDVVVSGYLRTLAVYLSTTNESMTDVVSCLHPRFTTRWHSIVKESQKKPSVVHIDGVLALGMVGRLALESSSVDQACTDLVTIVFGSEGSFVLPSVKGLLQTLANAIVEDYPVPEVTALILLPQALSWVLTSALEEDASQTVYSVLMELLCCSHLSIRQAAEQCFHGLYATSVALHLPGLLVALQTKLAVVAEGLEQAQQEWLNRKPSMASTPSNTSIVPASGILRHALRVVVPLSLREEGSVREKVLPRVCWLAHHPFMIEGTTTDQFGNEWSRLLPCFLPPTDDEEESSRDRLDHWMETSEEMKASIVSFASCLVLSSVTVERITTQRMMATLLEFAGNGESESLVLHDLLEERLMGEIQALKLLEMTEEDDGLSKTRDDELYLPTLSSEGSSTSSTSGQRGNEEEQWERQVREELERKKQANNSSTSKKLTGEEKAKLAQQQARRLQLKESLTSVERVIDVIALLSRTRPDELHPLLPVLFHSLILPLFQTRVQWFQSTVMQALSALTRAVSPDVLRNQSSDIASCIGIVLHLQSDPTVSDTVQAQKIVSYRPLFQRTLAPLMDFCFGFQFDQESDYDESIGRNRFAPPTLHLLFPVLETVLRYDPTLRHWVLPLLATHASMIEEEEEEEVGDVVAQRQLRRPLIEMVLMVMKGLAQGSIAPIEQDELKPAALLARICQGPLLSMEEWEPLLGELGLLSEHADVRVACLQALVQVANEAEEEGEENKPLVGTEMSLVLVSRLFLACFDVVEIPRSLGTTLWKKTQCRLPAQFAPALLILLNHSHANVREAAALAIADGMKQYPDTIPSILTALQAQFQRYIPPPAHTTAVDSYGNPTLRRPGMAEAMEDPTTVLPRCGVALCLEKMAGDSKLGVVPVPLTTTQVVEVVLVCIECGLVDSHAMVRAQMRKTGIQLVDVYGGGKTTHPLLETFEKTLDKSKQKSTANSTTKANPKGAKGKTATAAVVTEPKKEENTSDHQREGVVVFLGALAKHMDKTDPKVSSIVDALLDALSIPSESVQRSVATCLAPLLPAVKDRSAAILTRLLEQATQGELFGDRMGAAFGVSACIKGLGISALKAHDVIPRLEDAMKSSGSNARQGAMLVFECLSERLGILFEPYLIMIVPMLLKCFADASPIVREAASDTSKKMMANLSSHGVKLVLPSLLRALEESAWRTKQGGIQLLGSMAYCAPRQLGSCLPQVVPKITQALTDSHPKVREVSKSALRDIGSVVRNPEIASIASALLNALEEPNKYTQEALQQLQSTSFQHSIDAPSLALVMPILTRGLKDRAGDAKKKAALIVGSMCSMIHDAKDLIPYMEMVLPSLKALLMDPIPEVRGVAAKAMGKLVKGLGELHFQETLTWLIDAIKGDCGSVERSGAAQGLCEVLVALGKERVEGTLQDEIFPLARHPKASVREGVLWIIAFLPPALGKVFAVFLRQTLPIIVSGLSDEIDSVRDVAMHSGHVVVNAHALSHTKDILPSLESGLFDDHWRIRQSSVTLLGDLMYRISGTKAIVTSGEEEEDSGSAAGDKAIIKTLGMERRNAILSSLYMIRSDTSALVRQSALQVWKSVVGNTPKTLRQILSTLMTVIVNALSGNNVEKQTMAGRTLGEIVRKLGENVLPEVVPILRSGLSVENTGAMRQGACVGLTEVIECCTKKSLEDFVSTLVDAVLDGLCDPLPSVRQSAALAFEGLHRNIGYRAIDETVPSLLQRIKSTSEETQERALNGVQEILRVKSREVLPYLLPRLLITPLSLPAIHAISKVAQATGPVLHYQLEKIFATLIPQYLACIDQKEMEMANAIQASLRDVVLAIETNGVQWLAIEVCKHCDKGRVSVQEQVLAFYLMAEFCQHTKTLYSDQVPLFLRQIVTHLNDMETEVVQAAVDALKGMNHTISPEEFSKHVDFIRQGINSLVSDARHRKGGVGATGEFLLPALCLPKGLEHFLPAYQYALMNGVPELRQSAAAGLGELVLLSSTTTLRPYLIKLTGPLIRIAGDRFPGHVKAAILQTLEILLEKGGVALKPFLPQLQTTFVKALNDPSSEVRHYGTSALGKLVLLSPRVDTLIAELAEKIGGTEGSIREANLDALLLIMTRVGTKVSDGVRLGLEEALQEVLKTTEDESRTRAAMCLAMVVVTDPVEEQGVNKTLEYALADGKSYLSNATWTRKHSVVVFVERVWSKPPHWIQAIAIPITNVLLELGMDEHVSVRLASIRAIGAVLNHSSLSIDPFVTILSQGIAHSNKDVSKAAIKIVKRVAKRDATSVCPHLSQLVPVTFGLIKSNNLAVKNSAERALLYLLDVFQTPETLTTYVRTDAVQGKVIAEYARRVLTKLKPDSGEESE